MRIAILAAGAALLLVAAAHADTVLMPEKFELSGRKIEILDIRDDDVLVRVAYGEITIPRSRIVEMKIDFDERLARLKEEGGDTARALFALGRACAQLKMNGEAAAAYREAFDRENVPDDILLPMAAELEKIDAWSGAHKCYAAYLKLHPDDEAAAAKARAAAAKAAAEVPAIKAPGAGDVAIQLSQAPRAMVRQPTETVVAVQPVQPVAPVGQEPLAPVPPEQQPVAQQPAAQQPPEQQPAGPQAQEGLEGDPGWATEAWGSSVEVSIGPPQGTTDKMVRVFLAGAEQDKACVMLEQDVNLTTKKALHFDVYNFAKQSVTIAVAFTTSPGWKFYESVPNAILPTGDKPKKITIDLTDDRFKCAETNWRHRSPIQNRDRVVKTYILIYTKQTGAWLYFNNVVFEAAEGAPAGPAPAGPVPAGVPPAAPRAPGAAPALGPQP